MIGALIGIFAIVIFVTAHEAGHFIAAKATGMKATEFFFGFGPRLWSFRKGETEYGVKLIPAGGYVKIVGMNPFEEVAPEDVGRTYREKPFWKKSIVVLAGVGTNFLIAFIMFWVLIMAMGVAEPIPVVRSVVADSNGAPTAAATAGLQAGDRIVAVDGVEYTDWQDISNALASRPGQNVLLTIERNGRRLDVPVTLGAATDPNTGDTRGFLGVVASYHERPTGWFEGVGLAGGEVANDVRLTFRVMGDLIRPSSLARLAGVFIGRTDVPNDIRPVGPIGLAQIGSQVDTIGIPTYVAFLASVNVILATFNVLPLLPLDGGHFAVALWQKVTGREPDVRKLAPIAVAVIVLFTFLGLAAMILDIVNPIRIG